MEPQRFHEFIDDCPPWNSQWKPMIFMGVSPQKKKEIPNLDFPLPFFKGEVLVFWCFLGVFHWRWKLICSFNLHNFGWKMMFHVNVRTRICSFRTANMNSRTKGVDLGRLKILPSKHPEKNVCVFLGSSHISPGVNRHILRWMSKGCIITETKSKVFRFHYHSQKVIGSLGSFWL